MSRCDERLKVRVEESTCLMCPVRIFSTFPFFKFAFFFWQAQGSMAAKKQGKMPAESGIEEYFIVGSNFGGGGTLTAKGSKKVVCVCVRACMCVC
jgi:hypothetical protein